MRHWPGFGNNSFNPDQVVRSAVGAVPLNFNDASNGVLSYTVNGITRTKAITRLTF